MTDTIGTKAIARGAALSAATAALVALGACTDSVQRATYPPANQVAQPAPLTPAPAAPVNQAALGPSGSAATPPPPPAGAAPAPGVESSDLGAPPSLDPSGTDNTQVASVEPAASPARAVSREGMIGAWTVKSGGTNCQIFLALTKWSGGYRAATRGCGGTALSSVQAWDVQNDRIVLVDASGSQAASLGRTGDTTYAGATNEGGDITFTR